MYLSSLRSNLAGVVIAVTWGRGTYLSHARTILPVPKLPPRSLLMPQKTL